MLLKREANFKNNLSIKENESDFFDRELIKFLLKSNFDIDSQNKNGDTALILATKHHDVELIKLLLKSKANISIKNLFGDNALIISIK